jgi:chondroitin AC lyase
LRLVLSLLVALAAAPAFAADIDVVRANFLSYYAASGADRANPRMQEALATLEGTTAQITAPGWLLGDGTWTDIDYKDSTPDGGWSPWDHTRRLMVMAKAYRTPGQRFYRDARLLTQIDAGLAQVKTFYGASIVPAGNWWFWTIGIPLDLGPTLVLMRGDVDAKTYDDLVLAIHLRILSNPAARGIIGPVPVGENLVWSSFTHLCLALLKDDPAMLDKVRDAMAGATLPVAGALEGMKPDSSFHQHGAQLYTGGYGGSYAYDVARLALITRGTSYELPARSLAAFSDYLADGISWSLYGNYFDVSVIGREVARPTTTGINGIASLIQGAQFESPRANEIRSAAARMLQTWHGALPTELAALAAQVESGRYAAAWPEGHRHYSWSDYSIHRRNGWFSSVKMFSTRTKSGEKTNNENLRGSRQSDGRFYLVLDGGEYFNPEVFPSMDWSRLPGITVEKKADAASDAYGYGTRTFAGGAGDGRNGVAAMELAPLGSALTAKKAWFFFDDAIVFLTSDITSASANRVETVVNQWPIRKSSASAVSGDGSTWLHSDRIGYWFPSPTMLNTLEEQRKGTWAALGGSGDAAEREQSFFTLWIDHGAAPVSARAEYAIVPNITAGAMQSWAASRPLTILSNDGRTAAVRNIRDGATGIVFWSAGSIDGIQSDGAAIVYLARNGTSLRLSYADPNHGNGTTRITIPGHYTTKSVASSMGARSTTLELPRSGGATVTVELSAATPTRRRATR